MTTNSKLDLGDYFIEKNGEYLADVCRKYLRPGCKVLEIGSWKGKSTSIIAEVVKANFGQLYCIDTWKGSEGEKDMENAATENDIFNVFRNNLKILKLDDVVFPVVGDSRVVKDLFKDEYFDLVFIDGNHKYSFVISDLNNYLPKLKNGGVICGDDCEDYKSNLPHEQVETNKNNDWTIINKIGYHCGVIYSLYEKFNDEYQRGEGSTFWWKVVEKNMHAVSQKVNLIYATSNIDLLDKSEVFIPLDIASVKTVVGENLEYIFLEDFIGLENLVKIKLLAHEYNLSWFNYFDLHLNFGNFSLPQIDVEFLRWFWFQILVSIEIKKLGLNNKLEFNYNHNSTKPAEYYYPNGLTEYVLDNNNTIKFNGYLPSLNNEVIDFTRISDKIVFLLHPGEYERFKGTIDELVVKYKSEFAIIMIYKNDEITNKLKEQYSIDVVNFVEQNEDINFVLFQQKFEDFRVQLDDFSLSKTIIEALPMFEYLFVNRFPKLYNYTKSWNKIIENIRPKAVIGSRLPDAESQIPLVIAAEMKFPSFSIPHGVDTNPPFNLLKSEVNVLTSHKEEYDQYISSGWKENRVHLVSGLDLFDEYSSAVTQPSKNNKKKILVLVNPCGNNNIIYRTISVPNQINSILKLSEFADANDNYSVLFKTHPGLPNNELFEICGESVLQKLLPINSSLSEVLKEVDLVVGLNYSEAAIVHSVNSNKPVLLCWDDPFYIQTRLNINEFFNSGCTLTYSVDELMDRIMHFFNDLSYQNEILNKTKKYLEDKCNTANNNSYLDVIMDIADINKNEIKVNDKYDEMLTSYQFDKLSSNRLSIKVSIIIPTRNRSYSLHAVVDSIFKFNSIRTDIFEVIVVDNGSTDNTKEMCAQYKNKYTNFIYKFEPEPGLLSGRHAGTEIAKGEILTFVDDDIEVTENWLTTIINVFKDSSVHLAGGPSLPIFEDDVPEWVMYYFKDNNFETGTGYLSLFNAGNLEGFISPSQIWGLNYSIRKSTFNQLGGFHPDNINRELQYFQGDGESGLSLKLDAKGYRAFYSKDIKVYHNIYKNRLTIEYFKERLFYQGICDSYSQIRKKKNLNLIDFPDDFANNIENKFIKYSDYYKEIYKYYRYGFLYHHFAVRKSQVVYDWVLKENYFEYKLPEVPEKYKNDMITFRENLYLLDEIVINKSLE